MGFKVYEEDCAVVKVSGALCEVLSRSLGSMSIIVVRVFRASGSEYRRNGD